METINNWFLIFLGNALWQPLVIAAAALGCDILLRKASARQRHLLWVAALALCLLIPLLGASGLFHGKAPTTRVNDANVVGTETGVANDKLTSPTLGKNFLPMIHAMTQPPALLMIIVLACYWFSLLFHGIRMWRSWRRTRALLAASARRALPDPLASIKEECEKTIGLQNVALLSSAEIGSPLTAGKRSIVLPESLFDSAASDLLLGAIGHEMAHIKRRDFVCNLLYELLSMPLAFHPAVIFSKRRIKETRELACDELVTEKLIGAPAYARSLLQLADSALAFNRPAYTLGIFESEILEERIMNLIERRPRLSRAGKTLILIAVLSLLTVSSAIAAVYSRSLEQDSRDQTNKTREQEGGWIGAINGDPALIYWMHYRDAPLKKILGLLESYLNLDVMLDNSTQDLKISVDFGQLREPGQVSTSKPIEVRKFVEMILQKETLKASLKDDHTLFIYADTPENREKFAGMKSWP